MSKVFSYVVLPLLSIMAIVFALMWGIQASDEVWGYNDTYVYNATQQNLQGYYNISEHLPTIFLVIAAGIILSIVYYFWKSW